MKTGVIVSINHVAVEVEFQCGAVPQVFDVLIVLEVGINLEVYQQLGRGLVRAIAKEQLDSLRRGMRAVRLGAPLALPVGSAVLGRILNGLGEPIDDLGPVVPFQPCSVRRRPKADKKHEGPVEVLETGIKGIDLLCPIIKGGVAGLFGSPIAGGESGLASALLLHLSRDASTYSVYSGVGVRTREVSDLHHALRDENAFDRVAMVVASAGDPCASRIHAFLSALTIAERFRDDGSDVLLCLSDIFQYVGALHELSTHLRQIPLRVLLPPRLLDELESLAERSVCTERGFITSIWAMSTSDSDAADELREMASAFLDTSIVFSDTDAINGQLPAIDWLKSGSRWMSETVLDREHYNVARCVMEIFRRAETVRAAYIDMESLSGEDRTTLMRGRKLNCFLTQCLFGQETYLTVLNSSCVAGGPGKYVPLRETISGCRAIISGACDGIDENAFYFIGSLEDLRPR